MESNSQNYPSVNTVAEVIEPEVSTFDVKAFLRHCVKAWPWFLVSIVVCCACGAFYALRQQPVYTRTASVIVQDQKSGSSADISEAFSSLGLMTSSTDVDNELFVFTSPALMNEVVERLKLYINYEQEGRFHPVTLYGDDCPIEVEMPDIPDDVKASFVIELSPDGNARLSDFSKTVDGKETRYNNVRTLRPSFKTYRSPIGRLIVRPNGKFTGRISEPITIKVTHNPLTATSDAFYAKLKGSQPSKYADVIELTFNDVSYRRATAVLNMLIDVYNEDWMEDKNQIAVATTRFIHDRLAVIEQELGSVDSDISDYKSDNLIPDVERASEVYLQQAVNSDQQVLDLSNRLAMARYVKDYLGNSANNNEIIPANTGIGDLNIETLITKYNTILLDRNNWESSSSANNPLVMEYDKTLAGLRKSIITAVNGQIVSLSTSLRNTESSLQDSRSQIASAPTQAKYLLSAERQQKVKEALYMFLLQKLEENELSQAFTAYNTRVITPPMGPMTPIAPKTLIILAVSFIFGLLIPGIVIFIRQNMDTKVHSRKDIESVPAPFAGEVPLYKKASKVKRITKQFSSRKKKNEEEDSISIVVKEGHRNIINEAFRVVRSNVEFMADAKDGLAPVLMTTSFNAGSGKSFISVNLTASMALKKQRVLLIDGDMRHASVSKVVNTPSSGLANYLRGESDNWRDYIRTIDEHPGLDVIPVGKVPPNPAELLESDRIAVLLDEAKKEYDCVFIDCPPVNMVVDAKLFTRYADRVLFIVRAGLFEKALVPDLSALIRENSQVHFCTILNCITDESGSYYGKGYYGKGYYGSHYYHSYFNED
ncbi:MAG: polysaccharide biosynthesis tyrosine autokinase [Muribaculaceae bacterium]|nr:polysaccharide biosynthesis tyrosine autokinase [Muribaculaceae bacterium]